MKIKVLVLEKDENYLHRLVNSFNSIYGNEIEFRTFTDSEKAMKQATDEHLDVFLADSAFEEINPSRISERSAFAYLVEKSGEEKVKGYPAINKYQKVDAIYKMLVSLYSDRAGSIVEKGNKARALRTTVFTSPRGGAGSSSFAAGFAKYLAMHNREVLYLNLDPFDSPDNYFSGEGQFTLSDIIFALKNKNASLSLKIKSTLKLDNSRVYFISGANVALDLIGIKDEEFSDLVDGIAEMMMFDDLVIDLPFSFSDDRIKFLKKSADLVCISEDDTGSSRKTERMLYSLSLKEQKASTQLLNNVVILRNKIAMVNGNSDSMMVRSIGPLPDFGPLPKQEVIDRIAGINFFDNLYV